MFGYVNVNDKELTKEQRARFLRLYCGVCEGLKDLCGPKGRIVLSNDCTFLALVLSSLYEPEEDGSSIYCSPHPVIKHPCTQSEITKYAADINLLLAYHNMLDDWQDEGKKLKKLGADMLRKAYAQCAARRPEDAGVIEKELKNLSEMEKAHSTDTDELAGCFGRMLGEIFVYKNDKWAPALYRVGDSLGRFIYILDAWRDAAKDKRTGSFNALAAIQGQSDYEERVFEMLKCEMSLCADAIEAMPLVQDIGIIRNVIYSGVWTKYCLKRKSAVPEGTK